MKYVRGDDARVSQASELRRDRGVAVADVRVSRIAAAYESKRVLEWSLGGLKCAPRMRWVFDVTTVRTGSKRSRMARREGESADLLFVAP